MFRAFCRGAQKGADLNLDDRPPDASLGSWITMPYCLRGHALKTRNRRWGCDGVLCDWSLRHLRLLVLRVSIFVFRSVVWTLR